MSSIMQMSNRAVRTLVRFSARPAHVRYQRGDACTHGLPLCAQRDFHLTYLQLGLLPAMFMVGLMLACGALSKMTAYISSFRLVGAPSAPDPSSMAACQQCSC